MSMTRERLWEENTEYYKELITKYNYPLQAMLNLIAQMDKEGFCKKFYPCTSHETLILSTVNTFAERCKLSRVDIQHQEYYKNKHSFLILYRNNKGIIVEQEDWETEAPTKEQLKKIENWLENKT